MSKPVTATIGAVRHSGIARNAYDSSCPVIPGSPMSETITSKRLAGAVVSSSRAGGVRLMRAAHPLINVTCSL